MKKTQAAVILAAGRSTRFKAGLKQFAIIADKPVLFYSLETISRHPAVDLTIVVVPHNKVKMISRAISATSALTRFKIRVVSGGETRQLSALNALKYLSTLNTMPEYVIFHDAARPIITSGMVSSVIRAAKKFGGSVVAKKAIDLTFKVKDGFIKKAHNKNETFSGYTPQCFKFKPLWHAYMKFANSENKASAYSFDNIELLIKHAPQVKIIIIDKFYPNPKITFKEDIQLIKSLIKK